jgi:hypothetical protein
VETKDSHISASELEKVSLDKDTIDRLKAEAVQYKPYSGRISIALAFRLINLSNSQFSPFAVIDEMDYLENIRNFSRTKEEAQFDKPPLFPFWHKHFFSAQHLLKNIGIRWSLDNKGNKDLNKLIQRVAAQYGEDPEFWPGYLIRELVVGGFIERAERGLTGDWLIYAKHEGRNYYLDLATHEEGLDANVNTFFNKLKNGSKSEFPFLFPKEL